MKKIRILSVTAPGGDRGPAVGYWHHKKALSQGNFEFTELSQEIWESDDLMKQFDFAWAYVRFHPVILERLTLLGIPLIGGPNIVMERADEGIVDDWERWYLENSNVSVNLNVADYYCDRVREFIKNGMPCHTLEYCFESQESIPVREKTVDVLVYMKDRVNDNSASRIAEEYCDLLDEQKITYRKILYGYYDRNDYVEACSDSRVTAWFSIEDYCSLAQIESQLSGSCVIGSPYNLTIPTTDDCLCKNSQEIRGWVNWKSDHTLVAKDYLNVTQKMLQIPNLRELTVEKCKQRHSYEYYRQRVEKILTTL